MNVFFEFGKIAEALYQRGVPYALIGGVAMAFYIEPRFTKDIDFLISATSLIAISEALNAVGYVERTEPWTFSDSGMKLHRFTRFVDTEFLFVDVLIGLEARHAEIIASAVPTALGEITVKVATKTDLIWLKKIRNSEMDQLDIKKLRDDET